MGVAIWDTYVSREEGRTMHFDIVVPDHIREKQIVLDYGRQYLANKPFKTGNMDSSECDFCHLEEPTPHMLANIQKYGYSIIEMENCT